MVSGFISTSFYTFSCFLHCLVIYLCSKLDDMNKENLQRMADYIRTVPREKFDMLEFRGGEGKKAECDSVGCVIGHCTVLDAENIKARFTDVDGEIRFAIWSEEFTGLSLHRSGWDWCFSADWIYIDNTPEGAALRIEWLIENGLPEDADEQMIGAAKLCYR
jgi:hypothetical protein